jgi:uncharacterized protein (TIGR02246 family)
VTVEEDVEQLYRALLARWNDQDAAGYAGLFTAGGSMVGFDGSSVETADAIADHLGGIFADHQTAAYVAIVREVRQLTPTVALLRGVAGMVPPGQSDINPDTNAVQALLAVRSDHGWQVDHFQNTPAAFDGRPEVADALTDELRALLPVHR